MKLDSVNGHLEISKDLPRDKFKIVASSKAFEILSSGLYSDKIAAIIRELSTNAADSHIAAQQTEPFTVHLPNTMEPYLAVIDNGTGMSDEVVCSLYTSYFNSDRADSNDFTGCLGLGSKSPFCYVQQFTVRSRLNGICTDYACFVDDTGTPNISKLGTLETTEPNGVEVRLPVNSADFHRFVAAAQHILSWFKPQPVVIGAADFKIDGQDYVKQTAEFGVTSQRCGYSHLVMGNVAYRFEYNDVEKLGLPHSEAELARQCVLCGIDMFAPIGSCDIVASREQLAMTEKTKQFIARRISDIIQRIRNDVAVDLENSAQTIWQARLFARRLATSAIGQIVHTGELRWRGQSTDWRIDVSEYAGWTCELLTRSKRYGKQHKICRNSIKLLCAGDGVQILFDDMKRGGIKTAEHYMSVSTDRQMYLLRRYQCDGDNIRSPLEETGVMETAIPISRLPTPPGSSTARLRKKRTAVLRYVAHPSNNKIIHNYWQSHEVSLCDGGVYVIVDSGRVIEGAKIINSVSHPQQLGRVIEDLNDMGFNVELCGIRKKDATRVVSGANSGLWLSLDEFVKQSLEASADLLEKIGLVMGFVQHERSIVMTCDVLKLVSPAVRKKISLITRFVELVAQIEECRRTARVTATISLHQRLSNTLTADNTAHKLQQQINAEYPLLSALDSSICKRQNVAAALTEYVEHCYAQAESENGET